MDHSLPGSSVHGIFQARVLEWGAIAFSHINVQTIYKKFLPNKKGKRQVTHFFKWAKKIGIVPLIWDSQIANKEVKNT